MTFGEALLMATSWLWSPALAFVVLYVLIVCSFAVTLDDEVRGIHRIVSGVASFLGLLVWVALAIWIVSNGVDPLSWEVTR